VERVWKLLPQEQLTVICLYSGWIEGFMAAFRFALEWKKGAQSSGHPRATQGPRPLPGAARARWALSTRSVDNSVEQHAPTLRKRWRDKRFCGVGRNLTSPQNPYLSGLCINFVEADRQYVA
jgi:hypothetical protein